MLVHALGRRAALCALALLVGSVASPEAVAKSARKAAARRSPRVKASATAARSSALASRGSASRSYVGRLGQVTRPDSPIFSRPGEPPIYSRAKQGSFLVLTGQIEGWYSVMMADGRNGWIAKSRVSLLDYDVVNDGRSGEARGARGADPSLALGQSIIQTAYQFVRVPYKWGGYSTGGTDCSGFVKAVFAQHGIGLPRTAREQFLVGKTIPPEQMQPGDRVYFNVKGGPIDHTGIYIGGGYFVHSSISRGGVGVDSLTGKFARSFCGAKR